MTNFWDTLQKPVFALAPLSGITDSAFRRICRSFGADVVYSELSSATALTFQAESTRRILSFSQSERPYVVQLFGANPEHFAAAARYVTQEINPDGIDINFGCPIPKVFKRGAGAALMTDIPLAREVIQSVIENTTLPVSIKTRIKVKNQDLLSFLDHIANLDVKAVMNHGRTYAQRFSGPNDIETTRQARLHFKGIILANGGINHAAQGLDILHKTEADGIGVARGAMGNPWIFQNLKATLTGAPAQRPHVDEISRIAYKHAEISIALKGHYGVLDMRKHLCWYLRQIPGTRHLRPEAVKIGCLQDVADVLGSLASTASSAIVSHP